MTPIFLNSSSNNNYWTDLHHHQDDHFSNNQDFLNPNSQPSSSSNSLTTHMFLNSSTLLDGNGVLDRELHPPQHQQHKGDNFLSQVYKDDRIENNSDEKVHEFSTWNKSTEMNNMINKDQNQGKWMSSKMRVMLKMKKSDNPNAYRSTSREVTMLEDDHKLPNSPIGQETDNSSNSTTSNNIVPIRVCSDCNTTKTPLWRSGPRGPKSLCNACGIRQRKARRAALAAAAAGAQNGNNNVSIDQAIMVPLKVTKAPHKDHKKPSSNNNNGHVTKYKKFKRQYNKQIITTIPTPSPSPSPSPSPLPSPPSSSSPARKNCVEEFLVSLSKNLTFYRVFPQDEKEAAILLMALSCGYAHEI